MGATTSSLYRLRNRYLILLYNAGFENITLQQIFESVGTEKDGKRVISRENLLQFLGTDSETILNQLISQCNFQYNAIPLSFVLGFLESGTFSKDMIKSAQEGCKFSGFYHQVFENLKFLTPPRINTVVTYKRNTRQDCETEDKKTSALWKKHETVIQEKIIKHVTIEGDGTTHELVERDRTQNDIIHMECKTSGMFAHREYSQQEQTEELDNEVASFVRATEEYVHLKSNNDEYEHVHSDIPTNKREDNCNENDLNKYKHSNSFSDEDFPDTPTDEYDNSQSNYIPKNKADGGEANGIENDRSHD